MFREWVEDIITAFEPKKVGYIKDKEAYIRKRLLHKGYQILIKECKNNATIMDMVADDYFSDDCIFTHYGDYNTKEEAMFEILRY